jgi:hypothetical protein
MTTVASCGRRARRLTPEEGDSRVDVLNVLRRHRAGSCLGQPRGRSRWDGAGAHPGVRSEDAEVADEGWPWRRDEYGHAAEEGHRRQDEVRLPGSGTVSEVIVFTSAR